MRNRKRLVSILAGVMAAIMLLSLIAGLLPRPASAASSSEIRKQINELKEQKKEIQNLYDDIADYATEKLDEVIKKQEKLKIFNNLIISPLIRL